MSWFTRIAQDFEHNEAFHNYDISWDYETDDEESDPERFVAVSQIKSAVLKFVEELKEYLLPQIGIFKSFRVEFVNLSASAHQQDSIAVYRWNIHSTSYWR